MAEEILNFVSKQKAMAFAFGIKTVASVNLVLCKRVLARLSIVMRNYLVSLEWGLYGKMSDRELAEVWDFPRHKDLTLEVIKLFIIWLFILFIQARNRPVGVTGK